MTLLVLVADDNLLRTTLSELPGLTGADCWLLASPRYAGLLTPAHRATYSRVVVQDHFDEKALIDRMEAELFSFGAGDDVLFMTNDEGCELAVAALQGRFGFTPWPTERILPFVNKMVSKARLAGSGCGCRRWSTSTGHGWRRTPAGSARRWPGSSVSR